MALNGISGAQTLGPGDILFSGFNSDFPDSLAIVTFKSIPGDTVIYFRDDQYNDGWTGINEGTISWTTPSGGVAAGTVVIIDPTNLAVSIGTVSEENAGFNFANSNDIVYAYTSDGTFDSGNFTFLSAVSTADPIPSQFLNGTALTDDVDAWSFGSGVDNWDYSTGRRVGTVSEIKSSMQNVDNWISTDGNGNQSIVLTAIDYNLGDIATLTGDAGWRMLSGPVAGFTASQVADDSPIQGITGGADASFPEANFFIWNDGASAWTEPADVSTAYGDGYGFIFYVFNNDQNGSSPLPVDLQVSGADPATDVSPAINSGEFTLVGNPFSNNYPLDQLSGNGAGGANGGLVGTIHVWNDGAGTGSYDTFNFGAAQGNVLAPWQGFFLESDPNAATPATAVTFSESSQDTSLAADIKIFGKQQKQPDRIIKFVLNGPGESVDRAASLYFIAGEDTGRGTYDACKLTPLLGKYATLSFIDQSGVEPRLLAQESRAYLPEGPQEMYLDFSNVGLSGTFTVSWPVMKEIPADWQLLMTDLETGQTFNLRNQSSFSFQASSKAKPMEIPSTLQSPVAYSLESASDSPRFKLRIVPGGEEPGSEIVREFILSQNYPNPFNPTTIIEYNLPEQAVVNLEIYSVAGQKIATLVNNEEKTAGLHRANFDARSLASGVYFYRISAGDFVKTRKLTVIK